MASEELRISQRVLPHWRLDSHAYFVTWRLRRDQEWLSMEERMLVAETIRFFNHKRYELYAYVVMNDHAHVVFRLLGDNEMDKVAHTWKSYSANQLQRRFSRQGAIWVTESWDRVVRDEAELIEKCQYVLNNPAKRARSTGLPSLRLGLKVYRRGGL